MLGQARDNIRRRFADRLQDRLEAILTAHNDQTLALTPDQVGRRAISGAALQLLASLGSVKAPLIASFFGKAQNMTDRMAGLSALGQIEGHWFDHALDAFLMQWRHEPLVVDKWFAVQAAASRGDAGTRVRMLASNDLFSLMNPNRVRSLYHAFGSGNPRAFHAADGSGYVFLAHGIQMLDPLNPSIAAKLVKAFEPWRRFDTKRQSNARSALVGLSEGSLSRNSREMVRRILN
jgi:aminopeptidase N